MKTLYELLVYLRVRKKFWLLPLLILMLLCGWLIVIGSGTLGPFVYTLF